MKTRNVRTLLAIVLGVLLAGAGLVHRAHRAHRAHVGERWQSMQVELAELELRLDARDASRPALWGETTDERAEPHYDRAHALAGQLDHKRVSELRATLRTAPTPEARAERARLLEEAAPLLDALHRGAHARDASRSIDWSLGFEVPMRKLLTTRVITNLAEMYAARAIEEGRPIDGVNMLLDAMQLAGDLAEGPILIESMFGLALLAPRLLVDGVGDGSLARLPSDAAERLAAGLRALDERLSWMSSTVEPEILLSAHGLQRTLDGDSSYTNVLQELRGQLGSMKLEIVEFVAYVRQLSVEYEAAYLEEPAIALERLDELAERPASFDNQFGVMCLPSLESGVRARCWSLGRFRLLVHAIGGSEEPRDPWLRAFLRVEQQEGAERLTLADEHFERLELIRATGGS